MPKKDPERLLNRARELPPDTGVYLMKDAAGCVIYVGKALRLRDRVSSYFIPSADLGSRKQPMIALIADFDVIPCEGEWEALLMEARLVKDLQPRFNERLLDDKSFPYLVVTMRDEFPAVFVTHNPTDAKFRSARTLGPFVSGSSLRHAIQILQRVFKFRTCELDIRADNPSNTGFRPCLLHAIGQCTAPCANRITPAVYRADVERFLRFLSSKRSAMLRELQGEMASAAREHNFEHAAVLRDQIRAIERLDERERRGHEGEFDWQPEVTGLIHDPARALTSLQKSLECETPIRCVEAIDIAHLGGDETVGSKVCFVDGRPFKDGYRRYRIRTVANDDYRAIKEVVTRRYREASEGHELYPDLILIDGGAGQLSAALAAFATLAAQPPMVIALAKKEELIFRAGSKDPLRLGAENIGLKLCQAIRDEAHRFAQHYHHLLRSKRMFGDAQ
ncbi:MAG: excinuclease ABC subunit UvrC [Phycisphaerales bacterium]|nr:excinuclease ABC subunit UvrC [Phycisphaerales bacterium]